MEYNFMTKYETLHKRLAYLESMVFDDHLDDAELLYNKNGWKVYKINNFYAAQKYGANTKWAIANDDEYFAAYIKEYDLDGGYYFYIKDIDEKYCLLRDKQGEPVRIWDIDDNDIEIDEILDDVPDFPSVPVVWDVNKLTHNQAIELLFTDNKSSIQRGISAGADVYKVYPKYFESPLRYHVRQGRAWAVELLIKDNFSVDKCSHEIYLAIANSDLKVMEVFFKNGFSANDIDVSKDKPFFEYAMQYEDPDILNLFLAHGVFINKPIYSGGCTAFQYAIANELPYTARRLYKYAGSDLLDEVINDRFNKRVSLSFVLGVLDDAEINYTNHIA